MIPACAGTTAQLVAGNQVVPDDPRVRGDDFAAAAPEPPNSG